MRISERACLSLILVFAVLTLRPENCSGQDRTKFKTQKKENYLVSVTDLYRFTYMLGANIFEGSAITVGGQLSRRLADNSNFFLGVESSLSLYSPESIMFFLGELFYESRGQSGLGYVIGLSGGIAIPSLVTRLPQNTYAAFLDLALVQNIGDFVLLRWQLRPGLISRYVAILVQMNVSFLL